MPTALDIEPVLPSEGRRDAGSRLGPEERTAVEALCCHCGTPCAGRTFCCQGCQFVFELLRDHQLGHFYDLGGAAGVRLSNPPKRERFKFLDDPQVQRKLIDFSDGRTARVTFQIPAIHCIACVWLLENLFRLQEGIGGSQVNFPKKELSVTFSTERLSLADLVALLASIGYEPLLTLSDLERPQVKGAKSRLYLQVGVAGFAFGNIMLLSLPGYFGIGGVEGAVLQRIFGWISLFLALPVLFFSASDYWRSAWIGLRERVLTIEVPIALGLAALFVQSAWEVCLGRGEGYFDSLSGLVFFLLCGRLFQQKTYDRLSFDRDYRSFFPLAVNRKSDQGEASVAISELRVGDRLVVRNGELLPADSVLEEGDGWIDYSFVTGESEPIAKAKGDYLYAGGRQIGGAVEVTVVKPVSQSYLTSLWNEEPFRKPRVLGLDNLTNRFSRHFTVAVVGIAAAAAFVWWPLNPETAIRSFVAVLIVACPCALALAAPFALGTAQRYLGRRGVYLKNPHVIETLAATDALVFDKTGTLTSAGATPARFYGAGLSGDERAWLFSLFRQSNHPLSARLAETLAAESVGLPINSFKETAGAGIEGVVNGRQILAGSRTWLTACGVAIPSASVANGSAVYVAVDGRYRGRFELVSDLRPQAERLLEELREKYQLALLSGDNARDHGRFAGMLGDGDQLRFNQSPVDKLGYIRRLQQAGRRVMMVGDGLNDAGALRQSDVGVAIAERPGAFSPASDVILAGGMVARIGQVLQYAKASVWVVRASIFVSILYNAVGLTFAARGLLSPLICAILMPLSSVTVVALAVGLANGLGRRLLPEPIGEGHLQENQIEGAIDL